MSQWWVVLDDLPKQTRQTHSGFLCEKIHPIHLKMLKAAAALCQPRQHILFERKALLFHISEYKLFEAVIRQILTHHKIEELVGY